MSVLLVLDLVGVLAFALSGAMLADQRDFDLVGGFTLAVMAGLGGGIARDVLLGVRPLALERPLYLVPAVVATLVVYLLGHHARRGRLLLVASDAAGLGLFCATGAIRACQLGMNPVGAVVLGVTTAAGGGLLRDVVAGVPPAAFRASDIYVVPAAVGAALAVWAWSTGHWGAPVGLAIGAVVFAFRMTAWARGWRVPQASRSWTLPRAHWKP